MPEPVLQISNLKKRFAEREVLSRINLSLDSGQCLALLGESGSGKSTLSKMIAGLEIPDEGEICVAGEAMPRRFGYREFQYWATLRQMVFQDPYSALHPKQSILASLCEALYLTQKGKLNRQKIIQSACECLEKFGIESQLHHCLPAHLSGGQRQRVVLARAAIVQPKLLVLDEPTAALDVSVQAQIIKLLRELKEREQMALLFVTHDILLAPYIADSVAVLYQGKIVESGECQKVLADPLHPYTRKLVAAL